MKPAPVKKRKQKKCSIKKEIIENKEKANFFAKKGVICVLLLKNERKSKDAEQELLN